jgi:uncharacterized membrane protein
MSEPRELHDAERMKFFTDAVVAIAITLLILPLLDSVSKAASNGVNTAEFLRTHGDEMFTFVLSFVLIARFWVSHERLFALVEKWTGWLMVLNVAWMFTVVILPVVTAMVGSMETDNLQILLYVGTMLANSLVMTAMVLVVRREPALWMPNTRPGFEGLAGSLAVSALFVVALALALFVPGVGYLAMLVLLLSGPLQVVLQRRFARGEVSRQPRTPR